MSQQEQKPDVLEDFIKNLQEKSRDIDRLAQIMDAPQVRNEVEIFKNFIIQPNGDLTILRNRYDALIQSDKISPEMREVVAILNILLDQPVLANEIFQSIDRAKQKHNTETKRVKHWTQLQLTNLRAQILKSNPKQPPPQPSLKPIVAEKVAWEIASRKPTSAPVVTLSWEWLGNKWPEQWEKIAKYRHQLQCAIKSATDRIDAREVLDIKPILDRFSGELDAVMNHTNAKKYPDIINAYLQNIESWIQAVSNIDRKQVTNFRNQVRQANPKLAISDDRMYLLALINVHLYRNYLVQGTAIRMAYLDTEIIWPEKSGLQKTYPQENLRRMRNTLASLDAKYGIKISTQFEKALLEWKASDTLFGVAGRVMQDMPRTLERGKRQEALLAYNQAFEEFDNINSDAERFRVLTHFIGKWNRELPSADSMESILAFVESQLVIQGFDTNELNMMQNILESFIPVHGDVIQIRNSGNEIITWYGIHGEKIGGLKKIMAAVGMILGVLWLVTGLSNLKKIANIKKLLEAIRLKRVKKVEKTAEFGIQRERGWYKKSLWTDARLENSKANILDDMDDMDDMDDDIEISQTNVSRKSVFEWFFRDKISISDTQFLTRVSALDNPQFVSILRTEYRYYPGNAINTLERIALESREVQDTILSSSESMRAYINGTRKMNSNDIKTIAKMKWGIDDFSVLMGKVDGDKKNRSLQTLLGELENLQQKEWLGLREYTSMLQRKKWLIEKYRTFLLDGAPENTVLSKEKQELLQEFSIRRLEEMKQEIFLRWAKVDKVFSPNAYSQIWNMELLQKLRKIESRDGVPTIIEVTPWRFISILRAGETKDGIITYQIRFDIQKGSDGKHTPFPDFGWAVPLSIDTKTGVIQEGSIVASTPKNDQVARYKNDLDMFIKNYFPESKVWITGVEKAPQIGKKVLEYPGGKISNLGTRMDDGKERSIFLIEAEKVIEGKRAKFQLQFERRNDPEGWKIYVGTLSGGTDTGVEKSKMTQEILKDAFQAVMRNSTLAQKKEIFGLNGVISSITSKGSGIIEYFRMRWTRPEYHYHSLQEILENFKF